MSRKAPGRHIGGKGRRHLPVAMDDKHMAGCSLFELVNPVQQMIPVGMGAESLEIDDFGPDSHLIAKQLHAFRALQQMAAQRAGGLEAHKHHGAFRTPQVIFQVMADAAGIAHAGGGDDDLGRGVRVQLLGLVGGLCQMQAGKIEHVGAVLYQCQRIIVQIAPQVAAEDGGGRLGQRAVHIHIKIGVGLHKALVLNLADEIQQFLRAAHRKGGDYHIAALGHGFVDDLCQLAGIAPHLGMVAVAIGALHHHEVCLMEELGIADNGLVHIADVAGEDNGARFAVFRHSQLHAGGTKQVPRVDALHRHTVAQGNLFPIFAGAQKLLHPHGIGHGVQRLHIRTARPAVFTILILCVRLLNVGRILQHNIQQLGRQASGQNLALKALLNQHGDTPGVVDMGVCHQYIVNFSRVEGQAAVIHLVPSLLQSAIHQDFLPVDLQAVTAAGDALIRAEKAKFHGSFPFLSY